MLLKILEDLLLVKGYFINIFADIGSRLPSLLGTITQKPNLTPTATLYLYSTCPNYLVSDSYTVLAYLKRILGLRRLDYVEKDPSFSTHSPQTGGS